MLLKPFDISLQKKKIGIVYTLTVERKSKTEKVKTKEAKNAI
jgi:hypothetical protein